MVTTMKVSGVDLSNILNTTLISVSLLNFYKSTLENLKLPIISSVCSQRFGDVLTNA